MISQTPSESSADSINKVTSLRLEAINSYIKSAKRFRKSIRDQEIQLTKTTNGKK